MSPSIHRHDSYAYVYPSAPRGFLFHDDEGLEPIQLRRALRTLTSTIEEDDRPEEHIPALLITVNANTIAATYSLRAFPTPVKVGRGQWVNGQQSRGTEWLATQGQHLRVAIISDVNNPLSNIDYVTPSELYEQCTELVRFTGMCPCDLDGAPCRESLVHPHLTEITEADMVSDYYLEKEDVRFARYKQVAGFEYASPAMTTVQDFEKGNRPWDDHDFAVVPARKAEFAARGSRKSNEHQKRSLECSQCTFQTLTYKGEATDCGWIRNCKGPVSVDQGYQALRGWYDTVGFDDMPGFTEGQRNYLLLLGGKEVRAQISGATRRIKAVYAGFLRCGYPGKWEYKLSANAGDLTRGETFKSYAALRTVLPDLPLDPQVDMPYLTRLAAASLGAWPHVYIAYKGSLDTHHITVSDIYVSVTGCNTKHKQGHRGITIADGPKAFVSAGPLHYGDISEHFNS